MTSNQKKRLDAALREFVKANRFTLDGWSRFVSLLHTLRNVGAITPTRCEYIKQMVERRAND